MFLSQGRDVVTRTKGGAAACREKEAKQAAKSDKKAASLGFGSQGALGKSAGFMAQFVQRKSVEQAPSQDRAEPTATEKEAEVCCATLWGPCSHHTHA